MSVNSNVNPQAELTRAQRIIQVLDTLRIDRAHFAVGGTTADWDELVSKHQGRIASLSVVLPDPWEVEKLQGLASRLLIIYGDRPPVGEPMTHALERLPGAQHVPLDGFSNLSWDDPITNRFDAIAPRLLAFLEAGHEGAAILEREASAARTGEIAGVSYQLQGSGPAMVLLPLGLAPSQWDRLLPTLQERYCTLQLGGPELGILPVLEHRGHSAGFQRLHRNMLYELQLRAGEKILDVGCGTGVVDRWLAGYTAGKNPIMAVDVNAYFLREAAKLVQKEGFESKIELREANAVALPFEDNSFDAVFSTTVMEEVDADAMLAELVRVAKPTGRIGVIVRATDLTRPTGVQLRPELRLKCEAPRSEGVGKSGCAGSDLYRRFCQSGLTNIRRLPDWTVFSELHGVVEEFVISSMMSSLTPQEAGEWRVAAERASLDGTFFITWPHHCAVGTKPR